ERGRAAALELHRRLTADPRFVAGLAPELDIVVWAVAAGSVSEASARARRIFDAAAARGLHLALAELPADLVVPSGRLTRDREAVTCLRSVLMKPEQLAWVGEIWARLEAAVGEVGLE